MQAYYGISFLYYGISIEGFLSFTPYITVFRTELFNVSSDLPCLLRYTPLLCRVEIQTLACSLREADAPQSLQALRSLPQSITWGPLNLCLEVVQDQSTVLEVCAAFAGTPLAQAVSKLTLYEWRVEAPIAALRASYPNVLHFELYDSPQIMASISEAITAWPLLRSVSLESWSVHGLEAAQQHLEAAARTADKTGQPFEILLDEIEVDGVDAGTLDVLVASVRSAGGGRFDIRWVCQSW